MYNNIVVDRLVVYVQDLNGKVDKKELADKVKKEFSLTLDRKVYHCKDFAIRFSQSKSKKMSNTVLSLSNLKKYDNVPFFVCIVTSDVNYLLLANSTFLKKISHSSKKLRIDNIKGSFNGSDIMLMYNDMDNDPKFFDKLYAYHVGLSFDDNLERLVQSTNGIVGRVPKFEVSSRNKAIIMSSVEQAQEFVKSPEYKELKKDLDSRVSCVKGEIAIAASIDNVNIRGRVIECLITDNRSSLKAKIIDALKEEKPLPKFKTEDKLGDYSKLYPNYNTETDIKTKLLSLDGNPKAYNIDKLLEFLATTKSVYMIYLLGIDDKGEIISRLCSLFDSRLIDGTNIQHHWAGRNTRGVTQFVGNTLKDILFDNDVSQIEPEKAKEFLEELISK